MNCLTADVQEFVTVRVYVMIDRPREVLVMQIKADALAAVFAACPNVCAEMDRVLDAIVESL